MIKLECRPDTDTIEEQEDKFYSKSENLEFKECPVCLAKLGSPALCYSCYHNRRVIDELWTRVEGGRGQ